MSEYVMLVRKLLQPFSESIITKKMLSWTIYGVPEPWEDKLQPYGYYFDMEYRFNGRSIFNMSRSFLIITTTFDLHRTVVQEHPRSFILDCVGMNDGLFASASDFCSNAKDAQKYRLALYSRTGPKQGLSVGRQIVVNASTFCRDRHYVYLTRSF